MKNLSSWRSVRLSETALERQLKQRHTLWLHGLCLGTLVLALMWGVAHAQLVLGSDSLALRYLVTLGAGYLGYLLLLRLWAASLLRDDGRGDGWDAGLDLPLPRGGGGTESPAPELAPFQAGGGGDFGGGGAEASFDAPGDAIGEASGQVLGKAAEGALEVAGGADEGAVVVIPVVAIFLIGVALLFGTGSLLLLYFGSDALLAVAIELAFGYAAARTAQRVSREGWLTAAVRLTWKPLLGALACAVLLGATIDHFIPDARSLPHAIQLIRAAP